MSSENTEKKPRVGGKGPAPSGRLHSHDSRNRSAPSKRPGIRNASKDPASTLPPGGSGSHAPRNVRALAHSFLLRCETDERYVNIALDRTLRELRLDSRDRDFFTALVYGVTERRITLDYYISLLSKKPLARLDPTVLTALRMGLYQIIYMDGVPDSAACNESVKLVRRGASSAAPFVNAVLRSFIRRRDELRLPDRSADPYGWLSVRYSVPAELAALWCEQYGEEQAERCLRGTDEPPTPTLRANLIRIDRDALLKRLEQDGISAEPSPYSPHSVRLTAPCSPASIQAFREGLCTVQDDASGMAVEALAPKRGDTVIDMCSAPGGKSFAAAALMHGEGRIMSYDLYESKLSLIREGAERLGIEIITAAARDSSQPDPDCIGAADCVICDVPCSGFGVLAKKPDMRARVGERIADSELPQLQSRILAAASLYPRVGGRLLYSTCTLNRHENEEQVEAFLAQNSGYSCEQMHTVFPDPDLPSYLRTDGFFYAVLIRNT